MRFYLVIGLIGSISTAAFANVTGPDAQNFNPTTSGMDFVTVQSSETLEPGIFNLGLFVNYAVNTLPYFGGTQSQNRGHINDSLLMSDLNLGLGVLPNLEVGFSYPRLMRQTVSNQGARGQYGITGNTELRFMTKFRFFQEENSGSALVLSTNINRTKNNPFVGQDPKPTVNVEIAMDHRFSGFVAGLNLGRRFKQPGKPIPGSNITPSDDDWLASAAVSYLWQAIDSKIILEVFGSRSAEKNKGNATDRKRSSLEFLGGVKHFLTNELALHVGGGTELIHGASSPDWRAYAGINWTTDSELPKSKPAATPTPTEPVPTPEAAPLPPAQKGETGISFGAIHFKTASWQDILPGAQDNIQRLVEYLKLPPPFTKVVVEGHTDSIGSDASNLTLSQRRAETIRQILIDQYGIDGSKIEAIGYGESQPIADNGNYQGRQKNRRVFFRVTR